MAGSLTAHIGTVAGASAAPIPMREAKKTAKRFTSYISSADDTFESWSDSTVKRPTLFYAKVDKSNSIDYEPTVWVHPIRIEGENNGYITISARQRKQPVLAYGKGKAPQEDIKSAKDISKGMGLKTTGTLLYHGGVEYCLETEDDLAVDLRGKSIKKKSAIKSKKKSGSYFQIAKKEGNSNDPPDWSGSTDDEVYGVPNWTEHDGGGAGSTDYGTGDDSWPSWDGCSPVAASMVLGYHEEINEWGDEDREALIDRLHVDMNTGDDISTDPRNIDSGIENYSEGDHTYSANSQLFNLKGNVKDGIGNNNPLVMSMTNGPYSKDSSGLVNGHTVAVVGWREESCGWLCNKFYHKVHNGYASPPDRITNGNWTWAQVTRVQKE